MARPVHPDDVRRSLLCMTDRPRDRYGRPLGERGGAGFPGVPAREGVSSAQAWMEACAYLALDLPFHAHEVCELRWRMCPSDERPCWQTLARWTAALTHLARGNVTGAATLASSVLEDWRSLTAVPAPIDVDLVLASLHEVAGLQRR